MSSAWLGAAPQQDNFAADDDLPSGWYQVKSSDYSGSGFDRGHNRPRADRTGAVADNSAPCSMSNMRPHAPRNNQQTWAGLKNYCRSLVDAGHEFCLIAGSYGRGGTSSNGVAQTIASGRATVLATCWQVVPLPVGRKDVGRRRRRIRVIVVSVPNVHTVAAAWGGYRTRVNAIEATGYALLSAVPTSGRPWRARRLPGPLTSD